MICKCPSASCHMVIDVVVEPDYPESDKPIIKWDSHIQACPACGTTMERDE